MNYEINKEKSKLYAFFMFLFVRGERDRREWAWRRFLPVRQSKSDSKMR